MWRRCSPSISTRIWPSNPHFLMLACMSSGGAAGEAQPAANRHVASGVRRTLIVEASQPGPMSAMGGKRTLGPFRLAAASDQPVAHTESEDREQNGVNQPEQDNARDLVSEASRTSNLIAYPWFSGVSL
jgi:hypothetical protein